LSPKGVIMPKLLAHVCQMLAYCVWCEGPVYCCQETHGSNHLDCAERAHEEAMDAMDRESGL
jgi:hypothetical protein